MKIELISIGDELLIGQTVNTNVAWLGQKLSLMGFDITRSVVVRDDGAAIREAIDDAFGQVDLVILTGGLGPTKDDITKEVLCAYFDTNLELNEEVLQRVTEFFEKRGREMLEVNRLQAYLPASATVLRNDMGTASGMWFEEGQKVLISLPGVPYEMKFIMENSALEMLGKKFHAKSVYYRTIQVQGIGESYIAARIEDLENELRAFGLGLAYLPQPGLVRLRLTGNETLAHKEKIEDFIKRIMERLSSYAFDSELTLSAFVGNELRKRGQTLSTVESCTGGALAAEIVGVAGSSDYFLGSILSYANEVKINQVKVDPELLRIYGAVSREVVLQMAEKGKKLLNTDYCLATSGIAGPNGGSEEKPVGLVWIAWAGPNGTFARKFQFGTERERNIRMSVLTALNLLRCEIMGISIEKS